MVFVVGSKKVVIMDLVSLKKILVLLTQLQFDQVQQMLMMLVKRQIKVLRYGAVMKIMCQFINVEVTYQIAYIPLHGEEPHGLKKKNVVKIQRIMANHLALEILS